MISGDQETAGVGKDFGKNGENLRFFFLRSCVFVVVFTGPRCLWGPVYGSRCLYLSMTPLWNFADVTLADDITNSIRLMMPIQSDPLQFVINVIYASRTSWWSNQNCRNSGGKMKYNSDYQKYGDTKIRNIARGTTDPGYSITCIG